MGWNAMRPRAAAAAIVLVMAFVLWWLRRPRLPADSNVPAGIAKPATLITGPRTANAKPLIGEELLKAYGAADSTVEQDLTMMAHALQNFALLVKGDDPLPLGANEEVAAALLGKNRVRLQFLPKNHPALNDSGQLIDRWQTPLFFHAESHDRVDVRSAGPDRQMWTADDVHRRSNGEFLHDENLLAPSLLEVTKRGQGPVRQR